MLRNVSTEAIALADFLLMVVVWRVGFLWARRHVREGKEPPPAHAVGVSQSAVALLSLLLAFTFGTTYSKYESRRSDTVTEANAISTFGTRLLLLPAELRDPAREQLRRYVEIHRQFVDPARSREERREFDREIRALQEGFVRTITTYLRTPAGASLTFAMMPAMNAMLDEYEKRAHGVLAQVPPAVVLLLLVMSVASAFLIGRAEGWSLHRQPSVTLFVLMLVAVVMYVSLDLDQPWRGLTRTSELPMERAAESLHEP